MRRALWLIVLLGIVFAGGPRLARADLESIPYSVAAGDTGSRIATRHGLTLAELRALNDGIDLDRLRVGQ